MFKRFSIHISLMLCFCMALCAPFSMSLMIQKTAAFPQQLPGQQLYTLDQILAACETFYQTLFESPYDVNATKFNLQFAVGDPGLYSGANQNLEPFELNVVSSVQLDITQLDLPPATLNEMLDQNVTWSIVEAIATSRNGSLGISGMALSRHNASIPFESVFIPLRILTSFAALEAPEGAGVPFSFCIPIPIFCEDTECLEDCLDDYNETVEDAEAAADLAEANEQVRHDTQLNTLENNYNGAVSLAWSNYNTQMGTCAKIGLAGTGISIGLAFVTLGIGLGGLAATATALATCQLNASNTREQALNTAETNYNTGVANENALHEGNLQTIANNLAAAIAAAQDDLEDCQDDCVPVICGWRIICFWGYFFTVD